MLEGPPDGDRLATLTEAFIEAQSVFVNLEVPLTDRFAPADKLVRFRADPALAQHVRSLGADIVTVANNHAFDHGAEGMSDTIRALEGADLRTVGGGRDRQEALSWRTMQANGMTVAFLGLACTLPNGCGAGPGRPGVAPVRVLSRFLVDPVTIDEEPGISPLVETSCVESDVAAVEASVSAAQEQADAVVVACHWGVPHGWVAPYQGELAQYQQPLGRRLIDAGADAVIGHHPHVLHGVEIYRDRPIFYSLGNFLFHPLSASRPAMGRSEPSYSWTSLRGLENRYGGIARLVWERAGTVPQVELVPVILDGQGNPTIADTDDAEHALTRVQAASEPLGTTAERQRWNGVPVARMRAAYEKSSSERTGTAVETREAS